MPRKIIGVVGGGNANRQQIAAAEEVGRLAAQSGAVVATGGLGGVMEGASRGARSAGGITLGILPGSDPCAGNPYLDIVIPSGFGEGRNVLLVRTAGVLIAVGGEYGTLSEIAFALKAGKRVVGIGSWDIPGVVAASGPAEAVAEALRALG